MALAYDAKTKYSDYLRTRLQNKTAVIGIVGLGYVGLPNAVAKAREGYEVIGYDLSSWKVEAVNQGRSYIDDVCSDELEEFVTTNRICAHHDENALRVADVIVLCVPTPVNVHKAPDLTYLEHACKSAATNARKGALIILESTTYPGTTEEILVPLLDREGFQVGVDIFVAYSPERIDPGNKLYTVENTPKVVGGVTPLCAELACLFVGEHAIPVSSTRTAEMVKIVENTFRYINIGFVNEMAVICHEMGVDIWEVIQAAKTKPYGYMPFYPGIGVGGHCIPVDPYYLSWKVRAHDMQSRFIDLAGDVNERMPKYCSQRITEALNLRDKTLRNSRILVLGVAYKRDVGDVRESPILKLIAHLQSGGACVQLFDPFVPSVTVDGRVYSCSAPGIEDHIQEFDVVVVGTDHSIIDWPKVGERTTVLFDTKDVFALLGPSPKCEYVRL